MSSKASYRAVYIGFVLHAVLLALPHCSFASSEASPEGSSKGRPSSVVTLTDATFEHDTQAASGQTTGDWFVLFYSSKCTPCKKMMPIWEKLGDTLKAQMNVAKLDIVENPLCSRRFSVKSVPMVALFRHGTMYKYEGSKDRTYDNLLTFAKSGYEKIESHAVPTEETLLSVVKEHAAEIWSQTLEVHGSRPLVLYVVGGAGLLMGIMIGIFLYWTSKSDSSAHGSHPPSSKRHAYKKLD